jgi:hypothetical protein
MQEKQVATQEELNNNTRGIKQQHKKNQTSQ